ncbi:MAG: Shikimate kinase [Devosia sp.]|nr:Shikimate kinase [Devosia sp.]
MTEAEPDMRMVQRQELDALLGGRPLVLVGMMGAGKTTVGRKLATRLGRRFIDSDDEIEKAAGMKIPEIFASRGEAEFRAGEQRVIARLLKEDDLVLASGGGAFVNAETRALIRASAVSVFITAEFEILFNRVSRRGNRPLLKTPNPRETLKQLIAERTPIYAEADVTVQSKDVPQDVVAGEVVAAVLAHLRPEASHI